MRSGLGRAVTLFTVVAVTAAMGACSGGNGGQQSNGKQALVADTSFLLKTIDPARQFEDTGDLIDANVYQTALNFHNGDLKKPVDGLCSYKMSDDQKVLTLTLKDTGAKFSDGSKVTADDIVFSYKRVQGIKGNPSFFLDGVKIKKVDDKTITLTSKKPNPTLPYVLPNHSLGIVNADAVKKHGGSATESDDAEHYLNKHSQGSGPYMVKSYDPSNKVVLTANPNYSGTKPKHSRVVIRNVKGSTQKTNIQSGDSNLALNLSPDQISDLDKSRVKIKSYVTDSSIYLYTTMDPKIQKVVATPKFRKALRYSINYKKILNLGGKGTKRLASPVPHQLLGASDPSNAPTKNVSKAKRLLKSAGYHGQKIPFHYASDQSMSGIPVSQMAETLQSQLKKVGINLQLKPAPSSTNLDSYRSGKQEMGLAAWGTDFPDPKNYLVFAPDKNLGKRVRWKQGQSKHIDTLAKAAVAAKKPKQRDATYRKLYEAINENGPFLSLMQPATAVVANGVSKFAVHFYIPFKFSSVK